MIFFIRNLSEGLVFFYSTTGKKTIRFLFGSLFITYHQFHKGVSPGQVPYNLTPAYSLKLHRLLNPRQSLQVRTAVLPNKDSTPFKEKLQSFQARTGDTSETFIVSFWLVILNVSKEMDYSYSLKSDNKRNDFLHFLLYDLSLSTQEVHTTKATYS